MVRETVSISVRDLDITLHYRAFPCPNGVKAHYVQASGPTMAAVDAALRKEGWVFKGDVVTVCPRCEAKGPTPAPKGRKK